MDTFKFKITLDRHNAIQNLNNYDLPDPPRFSLPSTFKMYLITSFKDSSILLKTFRLSTFMLHPFTVTIRVLFRETRKKFNFRPPYSRLGLCKSNLLDRLHTSRKQIPDLSVRKERLKEQSN
jgi:hypothetical protein